MPEEQPDNLYQEYSRDLYRITGAEQGNAIMDVLQPSIGADNSSSVTIPPDSIGSGTDTATTQVTTGSTQAVKKTYDNTATGYILGLDPKDGLAKFYIGSPSAYINWDGTSLTVVGGVSISSLDIPDTITGNSFHVDTSGNSWWGATTLAGSTAKILNTGAASFSSMTISGGAISGTPISAIPNSTVTDVSLLEKTHNLLFSVTDADTIAWSSGTIVMSNGRTFSISAGNTGNMAALTYIYLDTAVSSTVLQTTTTYSTAMGATKSLLGMAQNNTVTASFIPYGAGQALIDGANIGALSIVAGNIAASTITSGKMNVSQLSAISADLGAITAGTITMNTSGYIRGGQTAYNTGTGFFLGYSSTAYKFSIGNPSGDNLTWDGTTLTIAGNFVIGGLSVTIDNTSDIQTAIDLLNTNGGGTVYLKGGTYTQNTALAGYSSVKIVGDSQVTTIIDFNSTAANLSFAGTNVYTTGTVTVASGTAITGSGTTWTAGMAGRHLFLGTRWYQIAAVTDTTHLVLAEAYGDNVTLPSTYRIASIMQNVYIENVQFKNSTGTALTLDDCRKCYFTNVLYLTNNKGFVFTNCSEIAMSLVSIVASVSNGCEFTNVGLSDSNSLNSVGNGGHNVVWSNVKNISVQPLVCDSATGDGLNATSAVDSVVFGEFSSNGGQGIEMVSGCNNFTVKDADICNNTSDGIKLTATSDDCKFYGNDIKSNGGYGINVAASTCDNNIISSSTLVSNSSGQVNDLGTGTVIRGNVGVDDNLVSNLVNFGGDGSDGALSISSGTTTIDLSGVEFVVKNYTSISITGTGVLAFSNPHANGSTIVLRSQGNVTITSSATPAIDLRSIGAAGGLGNTGGAHGDGLVGNDSNNILDATAHGGGGSTGSAAGIAGAQITQGSVFYSSTSTHVVVSKSILLIPGSGGGGGQAGQSDGGGAGGNGGNGGRGGGAMYIECAGAYNFTTGSIDLSGAVGANGVTTNADGGSGGGGAGGMFLVLYNSLTADSGTYTVSGGNGGSVGVGGAGSAGDGGGGAGSTEAAGSAGNEASGGTGAAGGAGAAGTAVRMLNVF